MEETTIHEWRDFDRLMRPGGRFQSWAFRGQRDAAWPLESSLTRHLKTFGVSPSEWPNQEARILRIFKRKAHLHLDHVPSDQDDFEWLALMQHYGAPTRLLDFTWSPYVAAFFALEVAVGDSAVFAVDTEAVASRSTVTLRRAGTYASAFIPGTNEHIYQGEPGVMNPRLVAQLGTFIVPGRIDAPLDEIMATTFPASAIQKVILPHHLRDQALRSLYDRNVHNAGLFPDLNGLAASLRYELEFHWAFDPRTGTDISPLAASPYARSNSTSMND